MKFKKIFSASILIISILLNNNIYSNSDLTLDNSYHGENIVINVKLLTGSGIIKGKNVLIICEKFHFTGIIRCTGTCKIRVKQDFNHKIFRREGPGSFIIIISQNNFEPHDKITLLAKADSLLFNDPYQTVEAIKEHFIWLRQQAAENGIGDSEIKKELEQRIKKIIADPMLLQKEIDAVSWIKIRDSLLNAGSGIIAFLSSIIILSKYRKEEAIGFACGLELVSLICLVRSYILYASADQKVVEIPRERLLFIQKKCVEIFSQPFVTDVKIIKL